MASDLAAISKLLGEVWHATYDGLYGVEKVSQITASWHSIDKLSGQLSKPNSEFLVADDGNRLAGMAFASGECDAKIKLHQLYVKPDCHSKGVGSMLMAELNECFFEMKEMFLEVEEGNVNAVKFYRKRGFSTIGNTENCGSETSGIPALIMSRKF